MSDPTRWRRTKRITFAGAGQAAAPVYKPALPGDVLNVRQLTVSTDTAAEIVVYFGSLAADRLVEDKAIEDMFIGANGGASPDLACLGAWSPAGGLPVQIWASVACNLSIAIAGTVES